MKSVFSIFQRGLQKTATSLSRNFVSIFKDIGKWDAASYKKLEDALIAADFGVKSSAKITADIKDRYERGLIKVSSDIVETAKSDIAAMLRQNARELNFAKSGPTVILIAGVNGSGKTTTAGKLAYLWKNDGKKVFLAACDTFRAAAAEQLKLWAEKTEAQLIFSKHGADPSAVAFDAVQAAASRGADILLIDTAGRQHTKKGLMDELSKMRRAIAKTMPDAPHETLLTIDSGIGANALSQAREFAKAAGVTGIVLTKLDGTGKGGMAAAILDELGLPVFFAGLGEAPEDIQPFDPDFYANAIFNEE
jgi:fused signal recognition particle receptor